MPKTLHFRLPITKTGIWNTGQIKNTVFWSISAGLVSLFNINKIRQNKAYYADAIKDVFKFTAFVEFLVGVHTFSYWIELFILPATTFLVLLAFFARKDQKNASVAKFVNGLLSIIGFCLIAYALYWIIGHFKSLATKDTLSDFLVPSILTLCFLPFIFLLSVYMSYETGFIGLRTVLQDTGLYAFAKRTAILHFKFRVKDFNRWKNSLFSHQIKTKEELLLSLKKMKELNKIEANPPQVDPNMGWSPYKAKDFLKKSGLETGFYNDYGDNEWQAGSDVISLNDHDIISNVISYFVIGDAQRAKKLKLLLGVHNPETATTAHKKLLDLTELLYKEALKADLPEIFKKSIQNGRNLTATEGNKKVSVSKKNWKGHRLGGYHLISIIEIERDK
ncbi:hypothetical protein SIO70_23135 [Chitinophaga sancti]|uniref:hypothetical protein n=1 Tax=Chitinophaga sancti TaxID=1004 RepID=UPI002A74D217|nr:hypothetical protein [Chitinophaga sancti]WPQ61257.1 hypothetical protein SIO70_23135 [Chitinophaga sancti]